MAVIDLAPGTVVADRYRLDRLVGQGGMATIWAAEDIATGERVALKLMKDAGADPDARRRFLHEARAASAVRHPSVVRIFDVLELTAGPATGPTIGSTMVPAIVMELLDGESLRVRLERDRALPLAALAEIAVPVVSAIGAAHALGIVHRDVKPENIFLTRGGDHRVVVLDFGIAKLTALDGEAMRSTGLTTNAVLGTPAYMAPEQVFGESDIDHRADIWALGVVLYECLSGIRPTSGDNIGQILKNVLGRPFAPLAQLVPGVPDEVARLVARMLARERAQRPADLHDVLDVLAPFARVTGEPFGAPATELRDAGQAATIELDQRAPGEPTGDADHADHEDPAAAPVVARRGRRIGVVAAIAVAAAAAVAVLAGGIRGRPAARPATPPAAASAGPPVAPVAAASLLAAPSSVLACPVLRASGVAPPAGWLGAAAAAVACERARLVLGGRTERTLAPAELLDLPRGPAEAFPHDPFGPAEARDRTLAAARQRGQAYLDGEVRWSPAGFFVALSLRRPDDRELAGGSGEGVALYQAVRAAMAALVGPALIPRAAALDREVAAWARTDDVDDALAAVDLIFALDQNAGGLADECRRFASHASGVRELGPEGQWLCAYTLGQPLPAVDLGASDPSDAGQATRIRIAHEIHGTAAAGDAARLRGVFERAPTARGRSLAAIIESCLLGASDAQAARERAIVAVQAEPRNPEGGLCTPWEQLMALERDAAASDGAVRAMQAWLPWNSYAWWESGFRAGGVNASALAMLWRAHVLSPLDVLVTDTLARGLLATGDRAAARGVAAEVRRGGLALHDVESDLILAQVEASEARFGAALARLGATSQLAAGDTGWVRVQRFDAGWRALELAVLLGRARDVADVLVARFVEPEPTVLDGNFPEVPMRLPAICALATAPASCFARVRALRQQLPGAITRDTDDFLAGAERYASGDVRGAARAWRPLLGGRMVLASVLPDAMADAFERTGAPDLAERVDREVMKRAAELNGATLGHVREARRAATRGERDTARKLAEQVVAAWGAADEEPPALGEMRRLVATLSRTAPARLAPSP